MVKKIIAISSVLALPFMALAQTQAITVLERFRQILNLLVPILITVAVLWFFWGLIEYIKGGPEDKDKGKFYMIWAVIALFVMVSVFGLIGLIGTTFSIQQGGSIPLPQIPVR